MDSTDNIFSCVQRLQHPLLDVFNDVVALNLDLLEKGPDCAQNRERLPLAEVTTRGTLLKENCCSRDTDDG